VTVVEVLPRILPVEDEEISELARKAFEKRASPSTPARGRSKKGRNASPRHHRPRKPDGDLEEITVERVILASASPATSKGWAWKRSA
jgi:dihydrolipoamide dehydrogenase